jgi:hypothetical protein
MAKVILKPLPGEDPHEPREEHYPGTNVYVVGSFIFVAPSPDAAGVLYPIEQILEVEVGYLEFGGQLNREMSL